MLCCLCAAPCAAHPKPLLVLSRSPTTCASALPTHPATVPAPAPLTLQPAPPAREFALVLNVVAAAAAQTCACLHHHHARLVAGRGADQTSLPVAAQMCLPTACRACRPACAESRQNASMQCCLHQYRRPDRLVVGPSVPQRLRRRLQPGLLSLPVAQRASCHTPLAPSHDVTSQPPPTPPPHTPTPTHHPAAISPRPSAATPATATARPSAPTATPPTPSPARPTPATACKFAPLCALLLAPSFPRCCIAPARPPCRRGITVRLPLLPAPACLVDACPSVPALLFRMLCLRAAPRLRLLPPLQLANSGCAHPAVGAPPSAGQLKRQFNRVILSLLAQPPPLPPSRLLRRPIYADNPDVTPQYCMPLANNPPAPPAPSMAELASRKKALK